MARDSAVLALAASACRVSPPTAEEVRAIGFRTPEQAFRTFQVAARLDDPDLELRCFSSGFRSRHGASQLTWREVREHMYERNPWLRNGIAKARIGASERLGRGWLLEVEAAGQRGSVFLVVEEFAEAWSGPERVLDSEIGWDAQTGVQAGAADRRWFYGRVEIPSGVDAAALTELRLGREWKIDDFALLEDEPGASPRRAQAPPPPER